MKIKPTPKPIEQTITIELSSKESIYLKGALSTFIAQNPKPSSHYEKLHHETATKLYNALNEV